MSRITSFSIICILMIFFAPDDFFSQRTLTVDNHDSAGNLFILTPAEKQLSTESRFRAPVNLNPLIRLIISNGTNSDETVIYFNAIASNGYDAYDSPKMFNNNASVPEIYTRAGNELLVINGMNSYYGGLQIALGFLTGQANTFSIRASELRNINPEIRVILKDNLLNTEFDLSSGAVYSFTSIITNTEERFLVMFVPTSSTWTGAISSEWNQAGNWSNGTPGTITDVVIQEASNHPEITGIANCRDLTLQPNVKMTINNAKTLNILGNLLLQSSAGGTATLVNNGTLNVSGTTSMQQYLDSKRNWYMSMPFSNAAAPGNFSYYEYREPGDNEEFAAPATAYWKSILSGSDLEAGKGYIVNPDEAPVIFSVDGVLNNGTVELNLTRTAGKEKEGFNLIGNPYPSYLNISSIQSNADLDKSFWYRTRNSVNSAWTFDTYNIPGSIGTSNSGKVITENLPPMQAFWVRVSTGKTGATLNFDNTMRAHQDNVNNKFRASATVNPLVRLVVSNSENTDEAVIYFNQNAADSYDVYDSPKMFNNTAAVPEIYTRAGNEQLVINGLSQYYPGLQLPLGFVTGQTNNFSLRATELRNIDADIRVLLFDKQLNTEFDLTGGSAYSFSSDAVNTDERFAVLFKSASGTTDCCEITAAGMNIYSFQGRIHLNCNAEIAPNARFSVYNSNGQLVHAQSLSGYLTTTSRGFDAGVYLVKVENGGRSVVLRTIIN